MSTAESTATASALETAAPVWTCDCGRDFASPRARIMHQVRAAKTPEHRAAVAAHEAAKAPAAVEAVAAAPEQAPAAVEVAADPERLAVAREALAVAELATGVRSDPDAVTVREVEAVVAACPGIAAALSERGAADAVAEQLRAELGAADAVAEQLRAELAEARAEVIAARGALGAHNDASRSIAGCITALSDSVATVSATASHGDMALRFVEAIAQRDEARRALAGIADAWSAMQANAPAAPRQRPASAPRAVAAPSAPGDTSARSSEAPSAPGAVAAPGKRLQRCVSCGACVNAKRGERCAPCVTANKPVLSAAEWAALTDGARRGTKRTTLDRVAV